MAIAEYLVFAHNSLFQLQAPKFWENVPQDYWQRPANTKHLHKICTTSAKRLRRWSKIVKMLYKCFVFARHCRRWQPISEYSVKRSDVTRWKQGYITPLPHTSFCETQWRHSVKTKLYKTPPPYVIVLASSVLAGSDSIPTTLFYAYESACAPACASASRTQSQIFQAETHRILIEHKNIKNLVYVTKQG